MYIQQGRHVPVYKPRGYRRLSSGKGPNVFGASQAISGGILALAVLVGSTLGQEGMEWMAGLYMVFLGIATGALTFHSRKSKS